MINEDNKKLNDFEKIENQNLKDSSDLGVFVVDSDNNKPEEKEPIKTEGFFMTMPKDENETDLDKTLSKLARGEFE